jgi:hypothetical protein
MVEGKGQAKTVFIVLTRHKGRFGLVQIQMT